MLNLSTSGKEKAGVDQQNTGTRELAFLLQADNNIIVAVVSTTTSPPL